MARELYISSDMCQGLLTGLERRRLVASTDDGERYRYSAADADADRLVAQLEQFYRERRVAVISEIYSNPVKRVQTFADAFRLRREE